MINFNEFKNLREPVTEGSEVPKIASVLHYLACGETLDRFEAERKVHDHTLNSTISTLANDYGVVFIRERVSVPNWLGLQTDCKRYAIDPSPDNLYRCYWLLRDVWGFTGRDIAPPSLPAPEVV